MLADQQLLSWIEAHIRMVGLTTADWLLPGALLLTSQYPVDTWHERIADPTVADAMLDRLLNNAYTIELKGDSLRTKKPEKEATAHDSA